MSKEDYSLVLGTKNVSTTDVLRVDDLVLAPGVKERLQGKGVFKMRMFPEDVGLRGLIILFCSYLFVFLLGWAMGHYGY
jgi:hypothetical protein